MAKGDKYKVVASSLYVRSGPGTSYSITGGLKRNQIITEVSNNGTWLQISNGWCSMQYLIAYQTTTSTVTTTPSATDTTAKTDYAVNTGSDYGEEAGSGYRPESIYNGEVTSDGTIETSDYVRIGDVMGVFGLPYQFLPNADVRINYSNRNDGIGKEYADKIAGKIPLLFIAPGRPDFMTRYSKSETENVLEKTIKAASGAFSSSKGSLEDLLSTNGRYYTFRYELSEYYNYVNPMCRIAARYLDIQDFQLDNTRLDMMHWGDFVCNKSSLLGNVADYTNIPFYLDTETSISESFDNQLTESSLASTVNGISDLGRELNFLTGYSGEALNSDLLRNVDIAESMENLNDTINDILGKGNFLTNLTKHLSTVASGGRLIFPKIWSDASMSRSYDVKVKLVAPDNNKLSVYLNVLVPLFHLIGLVAPQSIATNPNGYTSPFIVRAMYKSFFNVDMGIITSMSINKGGNSSWTVDGIPTSIEVDFTIKDLYDMAFTITGSSADDFKYDTLDNTAQLDYIANLCGINMYKPEIGRQLSMWIANGLNKGFDIPRNLWLNLNQSLSSKYQTFFRSY